MKFAAILADPPWAFVTYSDAGKDRSAESHYATMSPEALEALPVADMAADDAALFVWATWPTLPQALALGTAWGFEFKTLAFLWAKLVASKARQATFLPIEDDANWHMGMGYFTRSNTEPCLLFTRGQPKRLSAAVRQLVVAPVAAHSRKPETVHERIEHLVVGPYLELFARRPHPGWTCVGNEITGRDIADDLRILTLLS